MTTKLLRSLFASNTGRQLHQYPLHPLSGSCSGSFVRYLLIWNVDCSFNMFFVHILPEVRTSTMIMPLFSSIFVSPLPLIFCDMPLPLH